MIMDNNKTLTNMLYQLQIHINESEKFADEYLINNRLPGLVNNIITINNDENNEDDVDLYKYCVENDYLNNGEYALIAYYGYNESWYVRKTFDGFLQFLNVMENFDDKDFFQLFIENYKYVKVY